MVLRLIFSLLIICASFFSFSVKAQSSKYGVTVITHGFTPVGGIPQEWKNFAKAIRKRAKGGSIFVNDPNTGLWQKLDGENSNNPNQEIILLYDWAWASNNTRPGYLEGAADHLFALLMDPPAALNLKSKEALVRKPLHLIGHSRGGVLMVHLSHKIGYYFNGQVAVDQLTLLDAHPAIPMGDCQTPGIIGPCPPPKGYNKDQLQIKLPRNVRRADNYFRQDGVYEDFVTEKVFGPYDGIQVYGISSNYYLNNKTLTEGSTRWGGAHAAIGTRWYYGTIDLFNAFDHPINTNWYNTDSKHKGMGPRNQTGYYHSRLGGGSQPPLVPQSSKISPARPAALVFNGNFELVDANKTRVPGWDRNGSNGGARVIYDRSSKNSFLRLEKSKISLRLNKSKADNFRGHSIQYIPKNISGRSFGLKFKYRVNNSVKGRNHLKVTFKQGPYVETTIKDNIQVSNADTRFKEVVIPWPNSAKGLSGSITIYLEGDKNNRIVDIDDINFVAQ